MFSDDPQQNRRPWAVRRRVRRSLGAGIAVAAAVIVLPATASAEPRPHHTEIGVGAATTGSVESAARRPEQPLLDACPIGGPSTFEDSWGWARSGGRRHEGVDIIAERGTPVIAVRDGEASFTNSNLGGRAVWLATPDGDRFYYAHLDAWEGESRSVRAGDVIGYVGSSGNAQGPHLHFETLPDGVVENPYPHTLGACVPPPVPTLPELTSVVT